MTATVAIEAPARAPRVGFVTYGLDRPLSGIGRYAVELAGALADCSDAVAITLLTPFGGSPAGLDRSFPSVRIHGRLLPAFMAAGPAEVAWAARRAGLDVVHDPMGISPFAVPRRLGPYRRVVTIHDMIPFVYPETHARLTNILFQRYIPRTLRYVDRMITDSEASKRDILRFFDIPESRVQVIACGVSARFRPVPAVECEQARQRHGLRQPYILTLGALQARKNLGGLFEAYAELRRRGLRHQLVVVGKKAWKTEGIFRTLTALGLEDDVVLTGYVDDVDLPALYSGASAFAFPSLYEGFGLPPLEAMACGTPVVTSNTSSLPEVVGEAGIMVDPHDVQSLADALERVLTDPALASTLRERGLERARRFTWERAARAHLEIYAELARTDVRPG